MLVGGGVSLLPRPVSCAFGCAWSISSLLACLLRSLEVAKRLRQFSAGVYELRVLGTNQPGFASGFTLRRQAKLAPFVLALPGRAVANSHISPEIFFPRSRSFFVPAHSLGFEPMASRRVRLETPQVSGGSLRWRQSKVGMPILSNGDPHRPLVVELLSYRR